MNKRELIEATLRKMLHAYPIAIQAYRLQVQLATYEDVADALRQDYPDAAEVVDLMALIARAALAEIMTGPETSG